MKCSRKRCIDCKYCEEYTILYSPIIMIPTERKVCTKKILYFISKKWLYQFNKCAAYEKKVAVSNKKGGKSAK